MYLDNWKTPNGCFQQFNQTTNKIPKVSSNT